MMTTLEGLLLAKDPAVIDEARQFGPSTEQALGSLLKHPDWEIRELALYCVDAARADRPSVALVDGLLDPHVQVRAAALCGLWRAGSRYSSAALLRAWERSHEPEVRKNIALLVGRDAGASQLVELHRHCAAETHPDAQEGCLVALALVGHPPAREAYVDRLHVSSGQKLERFLHYCRYIGQPWLLPHLDPLLDDKSNVEFVGLDGRPDLTQYLRVCDIVVELVASISGRDFGFPIGGAERPTNYTDEEIEAVRRYLRTST